MAKYQEWLKPEGLLKIEAWARDGLINTQIAHNMGINVDTLRVWAKNYPDISAALKKGKEIVDIKVENALLKRALGTQITKITRERKHNPETGEDELVITKTITEDLPPDTVAQIFWLKNRRPDKWRDKRDIDMPAANQAVVILPEAEISPAEGDNNAD